ncbi:MAG: hypothetical protein SWZ49_12305 [Cyanobacteriota bacterium]|nr:hypothetical protein [Cyanobacteriota bacterium]
MQSEPPSVQVNFTDEFKQRLRTLSKKYRHLPIRITKQVLFYY